MAYPASIIAYAFVKKAINEGNPITQMKLQKLVYFAHGLYLALHDGEPLINEPVQAWYYGPVVPRIYQHYKYYGSQPILDTEWLEINGFKDEDLSQLNDDAWYVINKTWDLLKNVNAAKLSNWTHIAGSPWALHYKPNVTDIDIPNESIKKYFVDNSLVSW